MPRPQKRERNGDGKERGDVIGVGAEIGVVQINLREEKNGRPARSDPGPGHEAPNQNRNLGQRSQEKDELDVRAEFEAIEQEHDGSKKRPRIDKS